MEREKENLSPATGPGGVPGPGPGPGRTTTLVGAGADTPPGGGIRGADEGDDIGAGLADDRSAEHQQAPPISSVDAKFYESYDPAASADSFLKFAQANGRPLTAPDED